MLEPNAHEYDDVRLESFQNEQAPIPDVYDVVRDELQAVVVEVAVVVENSEIDDDENKQDGNLN
jgi:hypothetical protein